MFGRWRGRGGHKQEFSAQALATLAPYARLTAAELAATIPLVERISVRPGLLSDELPADRQVFLHHGSLQIQTQTGYVLLLKAGTSQARFPVPLKPHAVSLYAAEPCVFHCIPTSIGAAAERPPRPAHASPELSPAEAQAIEALRRHFRTGQSELPSLPDLALKIGKAIDDPNNANEDIARLIQLDPSLTARLISVVNSAAFGGFNKITSINQATARLGRNKVRSLVYSCLLKGVFRIQSTVLKRRMEALWQHAVHVAALSFVLGRETAGIDSEQALLAGLVHDIGSVAVLGGINRFPVLAQREPVLDHVIEELRIDVGLQTLRQWGLLEAFGDVVRDARHWARVGCAIPQNADVVILAQLHALVGSPRQTKLPRIDAVPAFAKLASGELTPRHSLALLEAADADVREVRSLIGAA